MKNRLSRYVSVFMALLLLLGAFPARAEEAPVEGLYINLLSVPAYGDEDGQVELELVTGSGEAVTPDAYIATLFLQVEPDGSYWVKPTYADPFVSAGPDGVYRIDCTTGGIDELALVYHIFVLPAGLRVTAYEEALSACVDYVRVDRAEDGSYTVLRMGMPEQPSEP